MDNAKIKLMIGKKDASDEEGFDHGQHMEQILEYAQNAKDAIKSGDSEAALGMLDMILGEEKKEKAVEEESDSNESFEDKIRKYI